MHRGREKQKADVRFQFLEAARGIILEEGIALATAKNIGARAGFSYATIYNYYQNLNALLCEAVDAINKELSDHLDGLWERKGPVDSLSSLNDRVLDFATLMVEHFAKNVHVYYPFISTEIDFSYFKQRDGHPYAHPAYALLHAEMAAHKTLLKLDEDGIRVLTDVLAYIFHAKMHFFLRYQVPETLETLEAELAAELALVLARA